MAHRKVFFKLEPGEDGYPPFSTEGVWAEERKVGEYIIDNIPFFTKEATLGDTVLADNFADSLYYRSTLNESSNSLLRVVMFDRRDAGPLRSQLAELGCSTELGPIPSLIAVNVPETVGLQDAIAVLKEGFDKGYWDYEEAILRRTIPRTSPGDGKGEDVKGGRKSVKEA